LSSESWIFRWIGKKREPYHKTLLKVEFVRLILQTNPAISCSITTTKAKKKLKITI